MCPDYFVVGVTVIRILYQNPASENREFGNMPLAAKYKQAVMLYEHCGLHSASVRPA